MITILNDYGEMVNSECSENSVDFIKMKYPKALARCEQLFFVGNYSNVGRGSAYIDAMNELYEIYDSEVVGLILKASIFHEGQ